MPHISQWIVNLQYHKKDYETNKFFINFATDTAKTTPTIKNKIYIKRAAYQFLSTAAP